MIFETLRSGWRSSKRTSELVEMTPSMALLRLGLGESFDEEPTWQSEPEVVGELNGEEYPFELLDCIDMEGIDSCLKLAGAGQSTRARFAALGSDSLRIDGIAILRGGLALRSLDIFRAIA